MEILGGAMVRVYPGDAANPAGILEITDAPLNEVVIAGFHMQLDHMGILDQFGGDTRTSTEGEGQLGTTEPTCIEFENLILNTSYPVGAFFKQTRPHRWILSWSFFRCSGQPLTTGSVYVETGNIQAHGNELQILNASLTMKPIIPAAGNAPNVLGMLVRESGDKIEISVNGSSKVAHPNLVLTI